MNQTAANTITRIGAILCMAIGVVSLLGWYTGHPPRPSGCRALNATLYTAIADRDHAAAELRQSEERFRSAFDSSATGMALIGLDCRVLRVNAALCEMEQVLQNLVSNALKFHGDRPPRVEVTARPASGEWRIGSTFWFTIPIRGGEAYAA